MSSFSQKNFLNQEKAITLTWFILQLTGKNNLKILQSNVLNLAKMCKESNTFADCVIRCDDDDDVSIITK